MKTIKIIVLSVLVLVLGYFSVEIKPLNEATKDTEAFDPTDFAENYLNTKLQGVLANAVLLSALKDKLFEDKEAAFEQWSHSIAVGNIGYFLVNTSGTVDKITEDAVVLTTSDGVTVRLQTEFIYGNAIRDASGLVDNKEFPNTSDLNAIAEEINDLVRKERIPTFRNKVKIGDQVSVIGALELNQRFPTTDEFEILPIQIDFQ